jgi:hypothetical protein
MQQAKAMRLLEELRGTLEQLEDSDKLLHRLSPQTLHFYKGWMTHVLDKVGTNTALLQGLDDTGAR